MKYTNKLVKHAAVFILAAGFLMACNTAENKETKSQTEQSTETDTHHEHETDSKLSLNNGAKWKADSSTNRNVKDLYNVIADANPVILEDYQKTGKSIQTGINKMISECRMRGADHDALHHWLEPLMEENKKMSGVTSADEGKGLFGKIRKQLEKYPEYFE
ncbi:MAG: hypothetical protein ABIW38_06090 [Ferruginibacter sp.]